MTKSRIFKNVAASVISLSMLLGTVPAMASAVTDAVVYDHEVELLLELGVVTPELTEDMTGKITRDEFSEMLTAMLGLGGGGNAIEELYNLGIVHGYTGSNRSLLGDRTITTYEAVKMVVNALGYETLAELEGGYPMGYVKIAYEVDLFSGSVTEAEMTVTDAIRLMVDAGNAKMATISNETLLGGATMGGKTMFYTYFDVVRNEGLMTANGYTSIDGTGCLETEVIIAGTGYETDPAKHARHAELLGYYVESYAYDEDLIDRLIVAAPKTNYNKTVTVNADEYINVTGTNNSKFNVEYENGNGKLVDIDVENCIAIYNGKLDTGFVYTSLNNALADLTFIDNDKDGKYEVLKIDQYETYIVKSTDLKDFDIFAKYDKTLNFDPDKKTALIYKYSGEQASFEELTAGTALSVLQSKDGKLVKAYILTQTAAGTVDGILTVDGHTVIRIGRKEYVVTYEFENLSHADKKNLILGGGIVATLNKAGKIVEVENAADSWTYGYLVKTLYNVDEEITTGLRVFNATNKIVDFTIGERVKIDGISYKNTELENSALCNVTESGVTKGVRQLIRYKVKGTTITEIDTTNYDSAREDDTSLTFYGTVDGPFNKTSMFFYNGTEQLVGVENSTIYFTVPSDAKGDEVSYYVSRNVSSLSDNSKYSDLSAYSVSDSKIAEAIVRVYNDPQNAGYNNTYMILTDVSTVVNKNGEIVKQVTGVRLDTGATVSFPTTEDNPNTYTGVQYDANDFAETAAFGDTFLFRTFSYNGVNTLWTITQFSDFREENEEKLLEYVHGSGADSNTYASQLNEYIGVISNVDDNYVTLANDAAGNGGVIFNMKDKPIYLVDIAADTVEAITIDKVPGYNAEVEEDCKALVITKKGGVYAMVIYANISGR